MLVYATDFHDIAEKADNFIVRDARFWCLALHFGASVSGAIVAPRLAIIRVFPAFASIMQFVVKFHPEITIKSRPVRKQFIRQLRDNIRRLLRELDADVRVRRDWDKITIETDIADESVLKEMVAVLQRTPGITWIVDVFECELESMHQVFEQTLELKKEELAGKRFAVRCHRVGEHEFRSVDVERYVGGGLNQHSDALGVDLKNPETVVRIEIRGQRVFIINRRYAGMGGYPLGAIDPVLSLISGGFDSTVASYLTMKRGMRTHFVFFNLGGRDHEIGVKEVALYLWQHYGASSRVKFVTVPFEPVVAEILKQVPNALMGVVLKRMMLRAAEQVAAELNVESLVTGESVAQVSSQTLTNLNVIDEVSDMLVLRPLIVSDKQDIINVARDIGTEAFAASMPEYCGVISVKPSTRAKRERVHAAEEGMCFDVLQQAVADARYETIDQMVAPETAIDELEILPVPLAGSVVIDLRHPDDAERQPLTLDSVEVLQLPFFELHQRFADLDSQTEYMLYCDQGVMSRLHASHLLSEGHRNVKVFRPA